MPSVFLRMQELKGDIIFIYKLAHISLNDNTHYYPVKHLLFMFCGTISWYNPSIRCFNSMNQDPQKYSCLLTEQFLFCICVCTCMYVYVYMCLSVCVCVYTDTYTYKRFFFLSMYFVFLSIHLYNMYLKWCIWFISSKILHMKNIKRWLYYHLL